MWQVCIACALVLLSAALPEWARRAANVLAWVPSHIPEVGKGSAAPLWGPTDWLPDWLICIRYVSQPRWKPLSTCPATHTHTHIPSPYLYTPLTHTHPLTLWERLLWRSLAASSHEPSKRFLIFLPRPLPLSFYVNREKIPQSLLCLLCTPHGRRVSVSTPCRNPHARVPDRMFNCSRIKKEKTVLSCVDRIVSVP